MADTTDKKHAPALDRLDFLELRVLLERRDRLTAELNLAMERSSEKKALDAAIVDLNALTSSLKIQYGLNTEAGDRIIGESGEIKRVPAKAAAPSAAMENLIQTPDPEIVAAAVKESLDNALRSPVGADC